MIKYEADLIIESLLKDDSKRKLHFSLNNRRFYNCEIIDFTGEDKIEAKDDVLGNIPIQYKMILNIEPKRDKR